MKRIFLILLSINLFTFALAQSLTVKGKVSSTDGELLPGVNVKVKNATIGTITDFDGNYQLKVDKGDILVFTYVGFKRHELKVGNQTSWNVELTPDQTDLDEVVVVAYGKAKRITLTGAVSGIQAREIRNVPTSSLQNALTGKLPGFFSQQSSGQPGKDASDFFIRGVSSLNADGNKPLIIVDDVQYTYEQLSQINVNEIESISILKDASTTAIYGIKGANGVLVVKTRRGKEGKPQINVRLEGGIQTPVRTPDFLNSYNTAILVNEAYENDGMPRPFSKADVMAFRDHTDPYGHPDVNWYDEIFKKSAFQENVNVDISGGSKRLKYFVSAGYFTQDGMVKDFGTKDSGVNSNYFYRRFNYRTNIDFAVTDNLSMRLDISSRFMNINEPCNMNATGEIYDFSKMHPYSAPVLNPDGSYAYLNDTEGYKPTLNARLANEGYKRTRRNDNNILYGATWKMDFLTEGLSANYRLAYSSVDENHRQANRSQYPTYHYDSSTNGYVINPNKVYDYGTFSVTSGTDKATKDLNIQASVNYARVFNGGDHDISAMFLYNLQTTTVDRDGLVSAAVPSNFEGYTLTMGYKYKSKYLIDLNMAYNGTDRFGRNNRFGFFPAVGVGYAISEEDFFKNVDWLADKVQLLKVRASYGLVGSDDLAQAGGSYYLYIDKLTDNKLDQIKWTFGESMNHTLGGPEIAYYANLDAVWEKAKKFDIGVDMTLFDHWNITIDYFYDKRYDIFMERQSWPNSLGYGKAKPWGNVGKMDNKGVEFSLNYHKNFSKDLGASFQANLTYNKNKLVYKDEPDYPTIWKSETGKPYSRLTGYISEGLFQSQEEIDNSPEQMVGNSTPKVGDIKYRDLNGDGKITEDDQCMISKYGSVPRLQYGFGGTINYKKFDFGIFFSGSALRSILINGLDPFLEGNRIPNKNVLKFIADNHWSVDNPNPNAEYPRLGLTTGDIGNNTVNSTYWLRNGSFLRLKNLEIGYKIPYGRIYVSGANLLRFSPFDLWDPELSSWNSYPLQRTVNVGLQLNF